MSESHFQARARVRGDRDSVAESGARADAIDWENLPGVFRELRRTLGGNATLKLVRRFGGRAVYVPVLPGPGHPLATAIGTEAARALSDIYGGDRLNLPKYDWIGRQMRKREIRSARTRGESIASIALRHNLSRRRVMQILAEK